MTLLQERRIVNYDYHNWGNTLPDLNDRLAAGQPPVDTDTHPAPVFDYPRAKEELTLEEPLPKKHLLSKIGGAILGLLGRNRNSEPAAVIELEQEPGELPRKFDRPEFYKTTYEQFATHDTRLRNNENRKRFIDWQCQKAKLARQALQSNSSNGDHAESSTNTYFGNQDRQGWIEPETTELAIVPVATDSKDNSASFWFSEPQTRQATNFLDEPTIPLPRITLDAQTHQQATKGYNGLTPNKEIMDSSSDQTPVSVSLIASYNHNLTKFRAVFPAIAALTDPELYSKESSMH